MDVQIKKGLTSNRKYLDYFYQWNKEGSRLYDLKIANCKWFYNPKYEMKLLQSFSQSIFKKVNDYTLLVDLGSGNAMKTRIFIDNLLQYHEELIYAPVDISAEHLEKTSLEIKNEYRNKIDVRPFASDYLEAVKTIRTFTEKKLFLWFAGLLNLSYNEQIHILKTMAQHMNIDDRLFVTVDGTDQDKKRQIELSYLDPDGYTGRIHTNAIQRLNTEYNGNVEICKFDYKVNLVARKAHNTCSYIEKWMEALDQCEFYIGGLNLKLKFEKGEKLYFHKNDEFSCKYTEEQIDHICKEGSFKVIQQWKNEHIIALLLQKK